MRQVESILYVQRRRLSHLRPSGRRHLRVIDPRSKGDLIALKSSMEAVREAQRLLGPAPSEEGTAFHVRRLDKSGSAYFLVHIAGHTVCLDAATGTLLASAETPRLPVRMTREAALKRTRFGAMATAELVWVPSAVTQSMFDPLWAVTEGEHTLYVDQRGSVWDSLPMKRPGGAD